MSCEANAPYIIIGAGGHASVVADILYKCGCYVKGFLDDNVPVGADVLGAKVLGKADDFKKHPECFFLIGVGDNHTRMKIAQSFNLDYGVAVHPSAIVGQQIKIGRGSVLMAGCIVNPGTDIGKHCIINTGAIVDHDNTIGDFAHVSPRAALGGMVSIGSRTHVGIGSCVKNNVAICDDVVIGAGAAVVNDIAEAGTYIGVPARRIK